MLFILQLVIPYDIATGLTQEGRLNSMDKSKKQASANTNTNETNTNETNTTNAANAGRNAKNCK